MMDEDGYITIERSAKCRDDLELELHQVVRFGLDYRLEQTIAACKQAGMQQRRIDRIINEAYN